MTTTIAGTAFAEVLEALPARLRKRLDASLERAAGWAREESADGGSLLFRVDEETTVTVRVTAGVVAAARDIGCDCLLAPACLHRAAVASLLPVHDEAAVAEPEAAQAVEAAEAKPAPPPEVAPPLGALDVAPNVDTALSDRERAAAAALWDSAAAVLTAGLVGANLFTEAELARATHQARAIGLHRASAAGTRVAAGLRAARERGGEHRLERFTADLRELMLVTHQLAHLHEAGGDGGAAVTADELRGTARRAYQEHGSLRLYGLFTEPIVTRSGYAGVVSYAVDGDGVLWSTASVAPGGPSLVRAGYIGALKLGGTTLTHRDFSRAGVMVSAASSSADRRLGGGASTRAVRTAGVDWSQAPVAGLFDRPLSEQFARALVADPEGDSYRAGDELVFLYGRVLGVDAQGLVLGLVDPDDDAPGAGGVVEVLEARILRCALPVANAVYQRNFERLGAVCPQLRLIARPDRARPGTVHALAAAVGAEAAAALALPKQWDGRINLGIDRIPMPQEGAEAQDVAEAGEVPDTADGAAGATTDVTHGVAPSVPTVGLVPAADTTSLHLLRHHLEHAASAGRAITRTSLLERDCARLDAEAMHMAASLLRELTLQATPVRDGFARPVATEDRPKDGYALAWLAAAVYEQAATAELAVRQWSRAMG